MRNILKSLLVGTCFSLAGAAFAGEQLVIDFMVSSGPQRTEWNKLLGAFKKANPDVEVKQSEHPQEAYKKNFYDRIKTTKVDVAFWFAGAQLSRAKDSGLLRPIDETGSQMVSNRFAPATVKAVSFGSDVYGLPLSYYQWGFFYKKSLFARHGLTPPKTWDEFKAMAEKLKAAGIKPTQVGAKNGWPAMAWFDYLNMRINGLQFHHDLLSGKASFNDPKVVKVFETWKDMLASGYFEEKSPKLDWDEVLPYLYRDLIGVSLMGAFAATKFAPEVAADIGFFPFPSLSSKEKSEDAPLDILVFPASGKNPGALARFIKFMSEHPAFNDFNEATQLISPRLDAPPSKSAVLATGKTLLHGATGISFFFDRNASPRLAGAGNKAFVEFLTPPHDVAKVTAALAAASK